MTVLCFGTFDGLHPGHEDYFRQAAVLGNGVVVVVARDATVLQVKGREPRLTEAERLKIVQAHPLVQEGRLGYAGDKYRIIEEIRPDLILLGYDQMAFTQTLTQELERRGLNVQIRRAQAYQPERFKSSRLQAVCST